MNILFMVLLIITAVCFAVGIIAPPETRLRLLAAGLLAWVLVPLIQTIDRVTR